VKSEEITLQVTYLMYQPMKMVIRRLMNMFKLKINLIG